MLKILFHGCCFLGVVFQVYSQGYIVPNGVTQPFPGMSAFSVITNPTNGNSTSFVFVSQSVNTFQFGTLLDEGVRAFLVSPNQPVSLPPILANSYTELIGGTYTFANGSLFYVGLYTGATFPQNGIYNDPLFGWAQLVNNNGVISLLGSALEYGGGGIYAGTQNIIPVPEPSTIALTALGILLLGFRRWRNSSH